MKLTEDLRIDAALGDVWPLLLDVPRVAQSLPGASIDPEPVQGEYRGRLKIKLGPVTAQYTGVARLEEVDDDDHLAVFRVAGREARGQGTAEATIAISAGPDGGATRLRVETALDVTGRQAQLGRGIMEEVAAGVLREFASRLERAVTAGPAEAEAGARPGPAAADEDDFFDAGAAVYRPLIERGVILLAGVAAGLAIGRAVWRR